jgi:hypothetical protein
MGWFRQLFTRRRRYDELSESIREHLEEKIADLTDGGMTRDEAEQAARREFGNVTLIEERSREVWQWPTLESMFSNVKLRNSTNAQSARFQRCCDRYSGSRDGGKFPSGDGRRSSTGSSRQSTGRLRRGEPSTSKLNWTKLNQALKEG